MLESLFKGIFDTDMTAVIAVGDFLLCLVVSLGIGLMMALGCGFRSRCSRSFLLTLALLPAVVCVVIMMVNGNVGAGVAVAGAFSLVRFRSAPGSAREISMIFIAMGSGLIAGMGYLAFAVLFAAILCGAAVVYGLVPAKAGRNAYKTLNITVPEDLDYSGAFEEVLDRYTTERELVRVKTTNMGSLFRLTYDVTMKKGASEKDMIDELRCRNGNLEITLSRQESGAAEL